MKNLSKLIAAIFTVAVIASSIFCSCSLFPPSEYETGKTVILDLTEKDFAMVFSEKNNEFFSTMNLSDFIETDIEKNDIIIVKYSASSVRSIKSVKSCLVCMKDNNNEEAVTNIIEFAKNIEVTKKFTIQKSFKINKEISGDLLLKLSFDISELSNESLFKHEEDNSYPIVKNFTVFENGTGLPSTSKYIEVEKNTTGVSFHVNTIDNNFSTSWGRICSVNLPISLELNETHFTNPSGIINFVYAEAGIVNYYAFEGNIIDSEGNNQYIYEYVKITPDTGMNIYDQFDFNKYRSCILYCNYNEDDNDIYFGNENWNCDILTLMDSSQISYIEGTITGHIGNEYLGGNRVSIYDDNNLVITNQNWNLQPFYETIKNNNAVLAWRSLEITDELWMKNNYEYHVTFGISFVLSEHQDGMYQVTMISSPIETYIPSKRIQLPENVGENPLTGKTLQFVESKNNVPFTTMTFSNNTIKTENGWKFFYSYNADTSIIYYYLNSSNIGLTHNISSKNYDICFEEYKNYFSYEDFISNNRYDQWREELGLETSVSQEEVFTTYIAQEFMEQIAHMEFDIVKMKKVTFSENNIILTDYYDTTSITDLCKYNRKLIDADYGEYEAECTFYNKEMILHYKSIIYLGYDSFYITSRTKSELHLLNRNNGEKLSIPYTESWTDGVLSVNLIYDGRDYTLNNNHGDVYAIK